MIKQTIIKEDLPFWETIMTKTAQMIQNSSLVLSEGKKSFGERTISKIVGTGALVVAMAAFTPQQAQAQQYQGQGYQGQYQSQQNLSQRIPAEVVSVKRIRASEHERRQQRLNNRTDRAVGNAVGKLLGSLIGDQVGGSMRSTARTFGNIAGDMTSNRISQWRNTGSEVSFSQDMVMVTVDVRLQGRAPHRFEIPQSAAVNVKRGDQVWLMPDANGDTVVVPTGYNNRNRPRGR